MIVRAPKPSDRPALASLLGELGYPSSEAQVEERLRRLEQRDDVVTLVAEEDVIAAGFATVIVLPVFHADPPVAILMALVVGATHRGRGIGRTLVTEAEIWARSRGADRMTVASGLARHGAHAFYEKVGYEHTARRYTKLLK
ncbi:MAG TPA: GNAT family N-acetyltransferase [Candidatus Polarisedimenticolaceae bacterium]|nr:GNAT family N-acetyltransferase [Candidatus Polarisedimenticolaceae bacterium]